MYQIKAMEGAAHVSPSLTDQLAEHLLDVQVSAKVYSCFPFAFRRVLICVYMKEYKPEYTSSYSQLLGALTEATATTTGGINPSREYSSCHTGGSDGDGDSACSRETDQHKNASSRDRDHSEDKANHGDNVQQGSDDQSAGQEHRRDDGDGPARKSGSGTATGTALKASGHGNNGSDVAPFGYNMQRGRQGGYASKGRVTQMVGQFSEFTLIILSPCFPSP